MFEWTGGHIIQRHPALFFSFHYQLSLMTDLSIIFSFFKDHYLLHFLNLKLCYQMLLVTFWSLDPKLSFIPYLYGMSQGLASP